MLPNFARRLLVLFAGLFIFSLPAFAGSPIYGAKEGPAIEGYDAVAYFTEGKPVEGKGEFITEWNGAKWQFSTLNGSEMSSKAISSTPKPQYEAGYTQFEDAEHKHLM